MRAIRLSTTVAMIGSLLWIVLSLKAQTPGTGSRTGTITGIVRTPTGEPAVGMRVTAMEARAAGEAAATQTLAGLAQTDDTGRFLLEDIPPGRYYIAAGTLATPVFHPGVPNIEKATVITVAAGSKNAGMDFIIVRTSFNISGRLIIEGEAGPMPPMLALNGSRPVTATVAADGTFEFRDVPTGTFSVIVGTSGARGIPPGLIQAGLNLTPQQIGSLLGGGNAPPVFPSTVEVRDRDVKVELRMVKPREFPAITEVEGGGPAPRFTLQFTGRINAIAPAAGTFTLGLPSGEYRVSASGLQRGFVLKSVSLVSPDAAKDPFTLTLPEGPARIKVTLGVTSPLPWVKVAGRVTGAGSAATELAVVLTEVVNGAGSARGGAIAAAVSPEVWIAPVGIDGSFEFNRILPGSYNAVLRARAEGTALDVSSTPSRVVVVGNADTRDLQFSVNSKDVQVAQSVRTRIIVEEKGPLPRLSVNTSDTTGTVISIPPGPDGTFSLPLIAGEHAVTLGPAPAGYAVKSFTHGAVNLLEGRLKVGSGSEEIRITLGPDRPRAWNTVSGRITGLGRDAEARMYLSPVSSGATVAAPANPDLNTTIRATRLLMNLAPPGIVAVPVSADGTFSIPAVLQGRYRVSVSVKYPNIPAYSSAQLASMDLSTMVDVRDADLTGVEVTVPPVVQIPGRVTAGDGDPVPNFRLSLTPMVGSSVPITVSTAAQRGGIFRVNLPEGEYRAVVNGVPSNYAIKTLTYGSTNLLTQTLKVSANDSAELRVAFDVAPGGRSVDVSGRVLGNGDRSGSASMSAETRQDRILGADGKFQFSRLISGRLDLRLSMGGFNGDIWITANAGRDLAGLGLAPVSGRIEIEGGSFPPSAFIEARNVSKDLPLMISDTLDPTTRESRVAVDGAFSIILTEGEQQVRVVDLPDNYEVTSIRYGTTEILNRKLKIGPDDPIQELRVRIGLRAQR